MNEDTTASIDITGYTDVTKLQTLIACHESIEEAMLTLPEELYGDDLAIALVASRDQATKKIREEMQALGLRSYESVSGVVQMLSDRLIINRA